MANKLYQHIVTEPDVRGAYEKMIAETLKVFNGRDLFNGQHKSYSPKEAGADPLEPVVKEVVTTVPKRLDWTKKSVSSLLDFEATRDVSNCAAKADLVVDGVTIATQLPAVTLLSLEKRLKEIRGYYDAIPTLDLSKKWENSTTLGEGLFESTSVQYRTVKKTKPVIMVAATKEHPAQVKEVTEDVMIGTWTAKVFSGEMNPGEKAELLARIDRLVEATKQARMKANEVPVSKTEIGKNIFDFIHGAKK